jgi:hypothetical protein
MQKWHIKSLSWGMPSVTLRVQNSETRTYP